MGQQPNRSKTVEKKNATSHHVSDRHTIREHASRPEPSPSPERLRRRSAISRDNSVKNHPCREASQKQNATESSIQKRYHRLQSIHLIPMKSHRIPETEAGEACAKEATVSQKQKPDDHRRMQRRRQSRSGKPKPETQKQKPSDSLILLTNLETF
ncbi:BnaA02g33840D [Brassica napus]|uniref:BnaA02g33840D protein n=1 Tax=Brassica napus TaxID=3708 RepID=A0A078H1H4_BRANA|nr:BnaA02g33840D [Brassica napus]